MQARRTAAAPADGDVETSGGIHRQTVAAAGRQLDELTLIGERPVRPNLERGDDRAVGDIQRLLVRAEDHTVGPQILPVGGDHALRVGMVETAHREVDAAPTVGRQVVDAAKALECIALVLVGMHATRGRELLDGLIQSTGYHEQRALRVHRQRTAGVGVTVHRRRLAIAIQLHDCAVIVLRQQQPAVIGRKDAVGVVPRGLPDERPALVRRDHAGNGGHRVLPRSRRRRRSRAAPLSGTPALRSSGGTRSGACRSPATTSGSGRWRLARGNDLGVARIGRRPQVRGRRLRLGQDGRRPEDCQSDCGEQI